MGRWSKWGPKTVVDSVAFEMRRDGTSPACKSVWVLVYVYERKKKGDDKMRGDIADTCLLQCYCRDMLLLDSDDNTDLDWSALYCRSKAGGWELVFHCECESVAHVSDPTTANVLSSIGNRAAAHISSSTKLFGNTA